MISLKIPNEIISSSVYLISRCGANLKNFTNIQNFVHLKDDFQTCNLFFL